MKQGTPAPARIEQTSYHAEPAEAVLAALGSSENGLLTTEAKRRLAEHGPNVLPRAAREGPLVLLFRQIKSPLIYVLIASAALAFALGKVTDGAVVLGVVVLNTLIGFIQEYRAGREIEALSSLVPELATVLRDGGRITLPAEELVPGDVVLLAAGDKAAADMRLLHVKNLAADEAPLTGESVPVRKHVAPVPKDAAVADRKSMVHGGTLLTVGTGQAVVVATGAQTEIGKISSMLREAAELETPLTRSLARVAQVLTVAIAIVAALMVGVALMRGYPLLEAVLAGITLAVAAIPEGLPAIITIALAIGVRRMAARRAVVRKLPAVETLGQAGVVCTDKTGTLTRSEMTVSAIWAPSGGYELSGVGYAPEGELRREGKAVGATPDDVRALLRAAALCNDARLVQREGGGFGITGDPTEGALVVAAQKLGMTGDALQEEAPRRDAIPFESEHKYMATLHVTASSEQEILMKGAPEVVLGRASRLAGGAPLDRAAVLEHLEGMASRGMRVLAVASRKPERPLAGLGEAEVASGFELLGLVGMMDPPRPEAIEAVKACQRAGITVKMITGDHPVTAKAIGIEIGLLGAADEVVTGRELSAMSPAEIAKAVQTRNVFARVAPEHKLRLVEALQAAGQVVAMTGDGVNDAPALKQANIGVAMGITGTAVAKQAADIVLTDDNFASIRAAVEEGRRVYDNLIKALAFVLPTNIGEALVLLLAVLFFPLVDGRPLLPMAPVQILWINLVATVTLSLPLAFEAKEPNLMERPPRRTNEPILGRFVLVRTVIVALLMTAGALGLFLMEYHDKLGEGVSPAFALREAQTMAVTTMVLFQVFYLLNCRSLHGSSLSIGLFSNPLVYVGIGTLLLLQFGFVYLPFMHTLFGSAPLGAAEWAKAVAAALVVLPVIGLEKWWQRRRSLRRTGRTPGGPSFRVFRPRLRPNPS
ncbi:cation-translocating P-type ATPase [Polyangium mundeleinium]|uniref:HAD-IC family P-type ATPase n=1 Tax=Polyangium mundeleinium TaxID=2995306 RepID=A0ABT5F2H7_9BACT|nr:HAD-IC family P-type ATPase [Polyangium mundeleinium]MDC0748313.1 HAD-IC family P-type ATPase [Polyangium mundeleinium]